MTGTRLILPILAAVVLVTPADAGTIFGRKPKTEAQVKRLIDSLRTETDEKKRRTAIAELREADPRTHLDVIPALVTALKRDPSPPIRADAAEAIGQFKLVYGLAGLALEAAAESDPSRAVRDSAQQALWEYHLSGYRSSRGAGGIAGQTVEPPIAKPAAPRRAVEVVPVVGAFPPVPPPTNPAANRLHPVAPPPLTVPPAHTVAVTLPQPDTLDPTGPVGPRVLLTVAPPPQLIMTDEPPVTRPREYPVAPAPTLVGEVSADSPGSLSGPMATVAVTAEPPPELTGLPPISLPPTADLPADRATGPVPPVVNEYGPRVESPAARMSTGLRRFKTPE